VENQVSDGDSVDSNWDPKIKALSPCFERVAAVIRERYERVEGNKPRHALPSKLPAIIEACFSASMRMEEQRPTQFQVVCAHPDRTKGAQSNTYHTQWDIGLLTETQLTAEKLRKLAPAVDYENSAILVWDQGKEAVLAGIVRFTKTGGGREPHELGNFPFDRALRITAIGPGTLVFDNCHMLLGELADGTLTFPQALPIFSYGGGVFDNWISSLAAIAFEALPDYLKSTEANPHVRREWEDVYKSTLLSIVLAMRRTKRGGTLVITNNDHPLTCVSDATYQFSSWFEQPKDGMPTVPVRMQKYFRTVQECKHPQLMKEFAGKDVNTALFFGLPKISELHRDYAELVRAARFIGRLTAADGAVILKPDFSVCAIAAKLKTSEDASDLKVCRCVTNENMIQLINREIEQSSLEVYTKPRGMRFKSSLYSAGLDQESLVFSASVDGPVALFVSADDEVLLGEPVSFAPITLW
jgi:hypothetical protein